MAKKQIYISKMHCIACEKLLGNEFRKLEGLQNVRFDRENDSAEIEYDEKTLAFEKIQETGQKFGYEISEKKSKFASAKATAGKATTLQWINSIIIVLLILFVYRIFQIFGLLDKLNLQGNGINLGLAFIIGIVASLSSCLAVVGAVVIASSEKCRTNGRSFYDNAVKPNILFHIGRIATFFILGGILGAIGGEINISGNFVSIFTIIISIVMAWLGLNILGFVPSISKMGIRMPMVLTSRWNVLERSEHALAPFLLGGLTFFLPCGFTQSMQILALTSGNFMAGAFVLSIFALGTLPVLIILGITASWTKNKGMVVFKNVAGIMIIIFSVFTFNSAWALRGVKTDVVSSQNNTVEDKNISDSSDQQNYQVVRMRITNRGYEPGTLKIKSGIPVKWVIDGAGVSGCTSRIIIPSLNISKNITSGENIITFTPTQKGGLNFSCGMGMVRGKFIVE